MTFRNNVGETDGDTTVIAVAGNPNVGKSTLFNALTGMNQHTGNWPGKTVSVAEGRVKSNKKNYVLVDIPGTYSLLSHSAEEEVARNFICFGEHKATVIVCDATCLERNLNLVLQTMEVCSNVIVCVNLLDEAQRKGIKIDLKQLSEKLGVPVIGTVARSKKTLKKLVFALDEVTDSDYIASNYQINYPDIIENALEKLESILKEKNLKGLPQRWLAVRLLERNDSILTAIGEFLGEDISKDERVAEALKEAKESLEYSGIDDEKLNDMVVSAFVGSAEEIAREVVTQKSAYNSVDIKIDKVLTSKKFGYPIMLLLLGLVFWITITGANYVSEFLSKIFSVGENYLGQFLEYISAPNWLCGLLIEGVYRVPAWVISVMLPPMAIFFPLFTLLEDSGYLPRIAYNLDRPFKRCNSCGKQALTTCMGFGCNAVGVVGCRIIDSPRERMLAMLTNSFVPCNGRFPMIIAIISMFFVVWKGVTASIVSAVVLTMVILFGIAMTFLGTKILSGTLLRGMPSSYTLEMPSYRKPKIGSVIVRSVFDRTLFVLARSVSVAVPAGIVIWIMANLKIGNSSVLSYCADFLDPLGRLLGLDGVILMAFILGFPANEIVIPIALMMYLSTNNLVDISSVEEMRQILVSNGWTWSTALCTVVFTLLHWPCSTTVLTIKKETGSLKWALFSILYPTAFGLSLCMLISFVARLVA